MKRRSLGRGLDALLGLAALPDEPVAATPPPPTDTLHLLPIEQLTPNRYQPRQTIAPDRLNALADSIRAQGIVQPIVARRLSESDHHDTRYYEIIAGERRWRAAKIAGLTQVPVLVRDVSEQAAMVIALIENVQREDLNPLEEANALKRLLDEFHLTHQQIADAIGYSRAAVSNLLRLLDLHPEVQQWLIEKKLDKGHARALLSLDAAQQVQLAHQVMEQGWSVRETEQRVRQWHQAGPLPDMPLRDVPSDQESLSDQESSSGQSAPQSFELNQLSQKYNESNSAPLPQPPERYSEPHFERPPELPSELTASFEPPESPTHPNLPSTRALAQTTDLADFSDADADNPADRRKTSPPMPAVVRLPNPATQDPNIQRLQDLLSERLGARVLIQHGSSGKGRIVIHYNNLDELDGILACVKVPLDD